MIDGTPEVDHFAVDLYVRFVKVPLPLTKAVHPADPLPTNVTDKQQPEPVPQKPHRLMANIDAALEQQVFHVPETERKAYIDHDHAPDRFR